MMRYDPLSKPTYFKHGIIYCTVKKQHGKAGAIFGHQMGLPSLV